MMRRTLLVVILSTFWFIGTAQKAKDTHCATMEMDSLNRARFPQRGRLEDFEDAIQNKISELKQRRKSGRTMATVVSLPIIVHIVHKGEAVGTGTNISLAQVQSQIEVLNEDFRKKANTPGGASNNPVAADIEIEFCLSPVGEDGEPLDEPGIHRYDGGPGDWSRDQIENQLKPATIWDPNKFYNIWTVKFAAIDANLIGYAQFPDQSGLSGLNVSGGPASTDGVVVRFNSFGRLFPGQQAPYNRGRTLSHETGHWLGLRHIWGDGGCDATDFVDDTPPAAGASSGCQIGRSSCNQTNMVENYMDYSDDVCMNIFTEGQKTRMRAVIDLSPRRKNLIESNLCAPPVNAPPLTKFEVENPSCILLKSNVQFTDLSTNFPNEWHWEFEGGTPATSNEKNPRVQYNTTGVYFVSLWSKNKIGISDTLKKAAYITVTDQGLCRDFNNFIPGFTSSTIKLKTFGNHTGYLTGTNSLKSQGLSEFFRNDCGYLYISGLDIRFSKAFTLKEDAQVNFVVWNARGPQNAPGSVIERKVVLFKKIKEDILNNKPTSIVFDRETPVFGMPFQVGIELQYTGDSLAIVSSANGEATASTSWIKDASGLWSPMSIAFGANIAMDIKPIVGVNPSVQVAASTLLAYPGQKVVLNGRGASIFIWDSSDGQVNDFTGPQLIVNPTTTTTYITSGSGLELCNDQASTTVYVSDAIVGVENIPKEKYLTVYPNPGGKTLTVNFANDIMGTCTIKVISTLGKEMLGTIIAEKAAFVFDERISGLDLPPGVYLVYVQIGDKKMISRWISRE
jgi:PKD repeat protein